MAAHSGDSHDSHNSSNSHNSDNSSNSSNSSKTDPAFDDPAFSDPGRDEPGFDDRAFDSAGYGAQHADGDDLDRVETLIRVLYTLLFFLIIQVVEAAVGVIVFFQVVFALITNREPNPAVTAFARRVIEYGYQIAHYLTYNRDQPPFPFDELPSEQQEQLK